MSLQINAKISKNLPKPLFCFVTEVDLDRIGGAVTNDQRMIACLRKLGEVDVIYMEKMKHASIVAALFVFGFKVLRSLSRPYTAYFSRGLFSSTLLVWLTSVGRKRIVHQALSVPFPSQEVFYMPHGRIESELRYLVFNFLEKTILPRVKAINVASDEYVAQLVRGGVKEDRVWVLPFSVESSFFETPFKNNEGEVFSFGYVGLFHLYHALLPMIQAFDLFVQNKPDAQLMLAGEGVSRTEIEKEVVKRNLSSKVKFVGEISHEYLPSFLSQINCFILLMRTPGLPIGIIEAAAAGKAIITLKQKNDKALSRYFTHLREIYMVNSESPKEIEAAMKVIYEDSKLRQALASKARNVAKKYFSEDVVVRQLRHFLVKSL